MYTSLSCHAHIIRKRVRIYYSSMYRNITKDGGFSNKEKSHVWMGVDNAPPMASAATPALLDSTRSIYFSESGRSSKKSNTVDFWDENSWN